MGTDGSMAMAGGNEVVAGTAGDPSYPGLYFDETKAQFVSALYPILVMVLARLPARNC